MKKNTKIIIGVAVAVFLLFLLYIRSYNRNAALDELVDSQWSNVENAYQRRADLIPNLVNTVKGAADFEKETLTSVIEARSKATSVNIDADNMSAESFQQFQQAQEGLTSALSRLMVVVEKYPDLKANKNFLELQSQLEGTENRISVERKRYNEYAMAYNSFIKRFFIHLLFSNEKKPYFRASAGADVAPEVNFN